MNLVDKEILLERRRFAGRVFVLAAALILFVLAVAQGLLYYTGLRVLASGHEMGMSDLVVAWCQIMAVSLLAFLGAGWKTHQAWKESAERIGRLMDAKLNSSKNRLEASAELSQSTDALALAQRRETSEYLARNPGRFRSYTLVGATACCVVLLILNGALATKSVAALQKAQAIALAQSKKPDAPKPPAAQPYAKIDIVAPDSETRATPIEEVVVKGSADSDNGFSAVSMQASINGGPEKSIPVDPALFNKGGPTKFNQSLLLDELGAQPFDVVSYYLQGTSRHATPLKVASQMQFIEVRPFREDVHKAQSPSGSPPGSASAKVEQGLEGLISQQIMVSKRTWVIASNPLPATDPALAAESGKAGDAQDKIAQKTHALYQQMTQMGFSASIIDSLSQAETSMHQAVDKIKQPALHDAPPLQQHALGELVAATKDAIKEMATKQVAANAQQEKKAFKDNQKLPSKATGSDTNPISKLNQLINREQNVVKNMSAQPKPGEPSPSPEQQGRQPGQSPSQGEQTAQNQPPGQQPGQQPSQQPGQSPSQGQGQGGQPSQAAQDQSSPGQGGQQPGQQPGENPSQGQGQGGQPSQTASNASPSGNQPGAQVAQEQSQIGKELGDLQNQPDTPATSNQPISEAQEAAQRSADKLAAQDREGALSDAHTSEAAMVRALTAMQTEADRQMRDSLAQAQQQLKDAAQAQAQAANPSDQGKVNDQAAAARDELAQEKEHQQASGDPKLAQLAAALAHDYDHSEIPAKLAQLGNQPAATPEQRADAAAAMSKFADQIAAKRLAMQSETQNLEDTLKRIERVQDNMNAARGTPEEQAQLAKELQTDLSTALSDAKTLLPPGGQPDNGEKGQNNPDGKSGTDVAANDPKGQNGTGQKGQRGNPSGEKDQAGVVGYGSAPHSSSTATELMYGHTEELPYMNVPIHPVSPLAFQGLRSPLGAFRQEIEQRLAFLRDQEVLTYLNPDQSPEQYRAQVEAYYERISREAKAAAVTPPAPPPSQ